MKIEIELNVLQQILDALCYAHATNRYESERQARAIASIRAPLLEPVVEPVGYVRMLNGEPTQKGWCTGCTPDNCRGCGGASEGYNGITKG